MRRGSTSRLIAIVGVVLLLLGMALVVRRVQSARVVVSDFTQDYVAALALREGLSLYEEFPPERLQSVMPEVSYLLLDEADGAIKPILNFHPPFNAVLFVPISMLPYDSAIVLWSVLTGILYVLVGALVLRELDIALPAPYLLLLVGLGLCWYQFQVHMVLGQLSLLVVACVAGCWSLLRHGHVVAGGALLGLACLIKLFPGLLFLYLIVRRRWYALVAGVAVLAVGGVATLAVVGLEDMVRYVTSVAPLNVVMYGPHPVNMSLTGVWHRLLVGSSLIAPLVEAPQLAVLLVRLSSVALVGVLVWLVWRSPPTQHNEDTAFALFCVTMLLLSPITWGHVFPILFIPLGLLLHDVWKREHRRVPVLLLVVVVILALPDIEVMQWLRSVYYPAPIPWYVGQVFVVPVVGLALLWGMLARRLDRAGGNGEAD